MLRAEVLFGLVYELSALANNCSIGIGTGLSAALCAGRPRGLRPRLSPEMRLPPNIRRPPAG
jgi:hypothetical protein